MITLLLSGCRAGSAGGTPEDAALALREEYQGLAGWSAAMDVSVYYTETVYDFSMDVQWRRDGETVLTVTAPELVAGITARVAQGETVLEYDGAGLSLGLLDGKGLTAVSAIPWLMEQIDKGYMAKCAWAGEGDGQLAVTFRDPEGKPGTGTEWLLAFDRESKALLTAEVDVDGASVLTARFRNFTMELKQNDTGDGENLG